VRLFADPRALAELTEIDPSVPAGTEDRFSGYGIMGLPFTEGHVLALHRFPASSLGYGYTSVWYRSPAGRWTFWSDVAPHSSCARFFGAAIDEVGREAIVVRWTGPSSLRVTVGEGLVDWTVSLQATVATAAVNAASRLLTDGMWRAPRILRAMGAVAGDALGLGPVALTGKVPNGQRFVLNPLHVWRVSESTATVAGADLGPAGPLTAPATLGDFVIPRRGIFAIGRSFFEPFDPRRHSDAVVRRGAVGTSGIGGMGRDELPAAR
jgi:hypothetical protein